MKFSCLLALAGVTVLLTGCGGGGGEGNGDPAGSSGGPGAVSKANLVVTVTDPIDRPASGVTVTVYALDTGGTFVSATDSSGQAQLNVPEGRLGVFAVAKEFSGGQAQVVRAKGETLRLSIATQPSVGQPGGGFAGAVVGPVSADGRVVELTLGFFPVNGNNDHSTFADRARKARIEDCFPDIANDSAGVRADCVAGSGSFDAAYAGAEASDVPEPWLESPSGPAGAFETLLLMDQGMALAIDDPADRRLFAAKYFLSRTRGTGDGQQRVILGAFAADDASSGRYSALPQKPVTLFPVENPGWTTDGHGLFTAVDALATLEGGAGALVTAVDRALDFMAANASTRRRALVVVSDGADETCPPGDECLRRRDAVVAKSRSLGIPIVTIGFAGSGTSAQHESMNLLVQSHWGGAALWLDEPSQFAAAMADAQALLNELKPASFATFRLESPTAGAFASGRTVLGKLRFEDCPWDCYEVTVPFAVKIP